MTSNVINSVPPREQFFIDQRKVETILRPDGTSYVRCIVRLKRNKDVFIVHELELKEPSIPFEQAKFLIFDDVDKHACDISMGLHNKALNDEIKINNTVIEHSELAGRCMRAADKMRAQTEFNFLKFWAEPEAIPLCYMLFAYHQNAMICESLADADVVVEIYESKDGEPPHIMGTKDSVVYLALFKENEGIMPWLK